MIHVQYFCYDDKNGIELTFNKMQDHVPRVGDKLYLYPGGKGDTCLEEVTVYEVEWIIGSEKHYEDYSEICPHGDTVMVSADYRTYRNRQKSA